MGMFSGIKNKIKEGITGAVAGAVLGGPTGAVMGATGGAIAGGKKAPQGTAQAPKFGAKVNNWMGSNVGKFAIGAAVDANSDRRQFNQFKRQHKYIQESGQVGGLPGTGGSGTVMGSGPTTQIRRQQQFQASERAKDRNLDWEKAKLSAQAPARQATIAEGRFNLIDIPISQGRKRLLDAQSNSAAADVAMKKFQYDRRWEILGAKMGPENLKVAMIMYMFRFNLKEVLSQIGNNPEMRNNVRSAYLFLDSMDAKLAQEARGILGIASSVLTRKKPPK